MRKKLDENEILIILNAIDFSKEHLKSYYQEKYLNEQLTNIKKKLNEQLEGFQ
ncbi:hypothetical protein [Brevibacillus porteri]|uniref:hypothetical protein n=1 Tax=Brevibacillus porteri TaxID=2126350 RepID=UPI003D1E3D08